MAQKGAVTAWLLMAVGENRQHAGNAGYDDQADVYYTWDSTVAHHAEVSVGDRVALWDSERLLGVSVIEEIEKTTRVKSLFKCPRCGKAGVKERVTKLPRYRCFKCEAEFDVPLTKTVTVEEYRSRHDAAWTSLENLLLGGELRQLCEAPKSQQSMRPLVWEAFQSAATAKGADRAVERVLRRAPDYAFPQGHVVELVRVRRGQQQFREHLLAEQGESCAFTGAAPARVLEAGHLYSYAQIGVHHAHGGLLLRRDIHRLFDGGWLAVEPGTLKVDVSNSLERYPQYAALHGQRLRARLYDTQVEWLARHWTEHRELLPPGRVERFSMPVGGGVRGAG